MPVAAKINAAHPVSPETRLAHERLKALLADDAGSLDDLAAQVHARMTLRALTCSKDVAVTRFDSVDAVRELAMPSSCFREQDTELQKFYGIRMVRALLARPAPRPMKASGLQA